MTPVSHEIYLITATHRVRDFIVVFRNRLLIIHLILESKLTRNLVDFMDFMNSLTHRYYGFHDTSQSTTIARTVHLTTKLY